MPDTRRPHILLLTCHDIGRYIGAYGVRTVQTPNLDRLAAEGVRFDRAFTVAPSCSPSRAGLATGRYPHSNGVMGLAHPPFGWSLGEGEDHLAVHLARLGYETHLFGHQHVSPHVGRLGFQHLHGFDRLVGCHEHAIGTNVTARLEEFLAGELTGRPLYIEVNLEEPHRPYSQGGAVPDSSLGVSIPPYLPDSPETREEMAALQGAIKQGDAAVGRILELLDRAGLNDNLLVVFAADHGLAMPRAKCTLYDPGIEIALMMRWPAGGLGAGRSVREMVSNIDILPTLLEILGAEVPKSVQGVSFRALLNGEVAVPHSAVFAEKTAHSYYDPMRAIRTEHFKLIRNFEVTFRVEVPGDVQQGAIFRANPGPYTDSQHPPLELYDLISDPMEQRNLVGDPQYAEIEQWLSIWLARWMEETADPLLQGWVPSPQARLFQAEVTEAL